MTSLYFSPFLTSSSSLKNYQNTVFFIENHLSNFPELPFTTLKRDVIYERPNPADNLPYHDTFQAAQTSVHKAVKYTDRKHGMLNTFSQMRQSLSRTLPRLLFPVLKMVPDRHKMMNMDFSMHLHCCLWNTIFPPQFAT